MVQYYGSDNWWHDFSLVVADSPGWINGLTFDFSGIDFAGDDPLFIVRFLTHWASEDGFQAPGGGTYSRTQNVYLSVRRRGSQRTPLAHRHEALTRERYRPLALSKRIR